MDFEVGEVVRIARTYSDGWREGDLATVREVHVHSLGVVNQRTGEFGTGSFDVFIKVSPPPPPPPEPKKTIYDADY